MRVTVGEKEFTFGYFDRKVANISIALKLIVINMSSTLPVLLFAMIPLIVYDLKVERESLLEEQSVLAKITAQRGAAALAFQQQRSVRDNLAPLQEHDSIDMACVYGDDGEVFAYAVFERDQVTTSACPKVSNTEEIYFKDDALFVFTPVVLKNKKYGMFLMKSNLSSITEKFNRFLFYLLATILVSGLFGLLLSIRLQRIISNPILLINETANLLRKGDNFDRRVPYESKDEIGNLARTFNGMMERIEVHEKSLQDLAFRDALTGLYNRRFFMPYVENSIPSTGRGHKLLAVVLIDLDGFKAVNDTIGHDAGDHVLVVVSKRLLEIVRENDLVCRLGGDEFVVQLTAMSDKADIIKTAERILKDINLPIYFNDQLCAISASIGISVSPTDDKDAEALVKKADEAMYRAKRSGKNAFVFFND